MYEEALQQPGWLYFRIRATKKIWLQSDQFYLLIRIRDNILKCFCCNYNQLPDKLTLSKKQCIFHQISVCVSSLKYTLNYPSSQIFNKGRRRDMYLFARQASMHIHHLPSHPTHAEFVAKLPLQVNIPKPQSTNFGCNKNAIHEYSSSKSNL